MFRETNKTNRLITPYAAWDSAALYHREPSPAANEQRRQAARRRNKSVWMRFGLTCALSLFIGASSLPLVAQEPPAPAPAAAEEKPAPKAEEKADAPVTAEAEKTQPAKPEEKPAAEAKPEEAKPAEPAKTPAKQEANIRFQFDGMPYDDVVRQFAQMSGKPILGDVAIGGQLTFFDSQPYTYDEAMDMMNLFLETMGYRVVETGRYLQVVAVSDQSKIPLRILSNPDSPDKDIRPSDLVTVVLPIKHMDLESASKALIPMVSLSGRIAPLERANGILITDKLEYIQRIRALMQLMDQKADEEAKMSLKSIALKRASATTAATVVNTLLRTEINPTARRTPGMPISTISAAADSRSNVVMMRGSQDMLVMGEQLLKMLDEGGDTGAGVRSFPLETASAKDVAEALQTIFGRQQFGPGGATQPIYIYGDATMNTVLVRTNSFEDMQSIEKMVKEMDGGVKKFNGVRAFKLQKVSANALATVLQSVLVRRDARGQASGAAVAVTADPATNTLYVSGPADTLENADKLVKELDKESSVMSHEVHILPLKDADAMGIATTLQQMYTQKLGANAVPGQMPIIQGIAASNSILISASPDEWEKIKGLIQQIKDVVVVASVPVTRVVPLKFADPAEIAPLIQQIGTAGQVLPSGAVASAASAAAAKASVAPIVVVASPSTKSLVVVAPENDQERISTVIATLDVESTSAAADPIVTVRVKSGEAVKIAASLKAAVKVDPKDPSAIAISADEGSNTVLVRAPQSQRKQLEELIGMLDLEIQKQARELRPIVLKHVSAAALAPMFMQLYAASNAASGEKAKPEDAVVVAAAPGDKVLLVDAPRPKVDEIATLIAGMDSETSPVAQQVRAYAITNSSAVELAAMMTKLFAPTVTGPNVPAPPRFEANTTTNQLVVSATVSEFEAIEKAVKDAAQGVEMVTQTRTFRLKFARAMEVSVVLQNMLADASATTKNAVPLVRVGAIESSNDIVVQGPPEKLALAEQLVKTFDSEEAQAGVTIEVVKLANAQASSLSEAVSQVVEAKAKARSAAGVEEEPVIVSPEPNSNSVIIRGPEKRVQEVMDMVKRLDAQSDSGLTQMRIFPLTRGTAPEMAKTLEEVFNSIIKQQTAQRKGLTPPPFTVSADARTNSLVVSTTSGYFALVEKLIEDLDGEVIARSTTDVLLIALNNVDELDVVSALDSRYSARQGEDKPVFQADYVAHSVTVIAKPVDLVEIERLIKEMDKQAEGQGRSLQNRIVYIPKEMKASQVASKLIEYTSKTGGQKVKVETLGPSKKNGADAPTPPKKETPTEPKCEEEAKAEEPPAAEQPAEKAEAQPPAGQPKVETRVVEEKPGEEPDEVQIIADDESNRLIIIGTRRQIDEMQSLIDKLTIGADADGISNLDIFTLKHSDPEAIAQLINSLYNPQGAGGGNIQQQIQQQLMQQMQQQLPQGLQIFQGQQPQQPGGIQLPGGIQIPGLTGGQPGGRGSRGGGAPQPGAQGGQPGQQGGRGAAAVVAVPEPRTNRVIVRAEPQVLEEIRTLVERVDQVTTVAGEVRVFTLRNTIAEEVATNLRDLVSTKPSSRPSGPSRSVVLQGVIEQELRKEGVIKDDEAVDMGSVISVAANRQTNSVIVAAPAPAMKIIDDVIREIDQSATRLARPTVRLYKIKNAQASDILPNIQQVLEPLAPARTGAGSVIVTADTAANMLIVSASPDQHDLIEQIITDIDKAQPGDSLSVKVYRVQNAEAGSVAQTISDILLPGSQPSQVNRNAIQWLQGAGGASGGAKPASQALRIAADNSSNSIIVRATEQDHTKISDLLKELDVAPESQQQVRLIALKHADAEKAAQTLNRMFTGGAGGAAGGAAARRNVFPGGLGQALGATTPGGGRQTIAIEGDREARMLIVRADDATFKRIEEVVVRLDTPMPGGEVTQRVLQLKHSMAPSVAAAINEAFRPQPGQQPAPGQRITVVAEQNSNSIVVTGNDEMHKKVDDLLTTLDSESANTLQTEFLVLQNATAQAMATALQKIAGETRARSVIVSADTGTNSLIFKGPAGEIKELKRIAGDLDFKSAGSQTGVFIIPVKNNDATQMAATVKDLFSQVAQQSLLGGLSGKSAGGGKMPTVSVTADARSNSLIVLTDPNFILTFKGLVEQIDLVTPARGAMRIIRLEHADPSELQKAIEAIYGSPTPTSAPQQPGQQGFPQQQQFPGGFQQQQPGGFQQQQPQQQQPQLPGGFQRPQQPGGAQPQLPGGIQRPGGGQQAPGGFQRPGGGQRPGGTQPQSPRRSQPGCEMTADEEQEIEESDEQTSDCQFPGMQRPGGGQQFPPGFGGAPAQPGASSPRVSSTPLPQQKSLIINANDEDFEAIKKLAEAMDKAAAGSKRQIHVMLLKNVDNARIAQSVTATFASAARPNIAEDQVTVTPLPGTNAIMITAAKEKLPEAEALVLQLDIPGVVIGSAVRIVPLQFADAARIKQMIDDMYTGESAQAIRGLDKPVITVDPRTNALVVSSSDKTFLVVEAIIKQIDKEQPIDLRDIRLVQLKNAEAATLAATLQQAMDARVTRQESLGVKDAEGLRMIILSDPRSNSLIIGGSAEGYKIIETLIAQLDTSSPALTGQIQLLPLKHANAGSLSTTLQNLFTQRYQAASTPELQKQKPVILADLRTNSLLVTANADDTKILKGLLEKMDQEIVDPSVLFEVIVLKHNDVGVIAPSFQRLFEARLTSMTPPGQQAQPQDKVNIETDALTNSLIVSASKENIALIKQLLTKVDIEPPSESSVVRLFALKHADAAKVSAMLKSLVSQGLYKPGSTLAGANANAAAKEKVAVETDIRSNVLIVSASKENFTIIEQILKELDTEKKLDDRGDIKLYTLKFADATQLATTLKTFFDAKRSGEQQAQGDTANKALPVSVVADARTNTLLVTGGPESFALIEGMIKQLDNEDVATSGEFRIFSLEHATAGALQQTLQTLFDQRVARGVTKDKVTVLADANANSLIVGASPSDMVLLQSLLKQLDVEKIDKAGLATVRIFPLQKGDAKTVGDTLKNLFDQQKANQPQGTGTTQGNVEPGIGITVDERMNSLIISAGPNDMKRVEDLIKQLDGASITRITEIRVFTLENAEATELSTALNDTLTKKLTEPVPNDSKRGTILQVMTQDIDGKQFASQALQEGVLITPDKRSNSLIVTAPLDYMALIDRLVKKLDSTSPREAELRTFSLTNADATQLAEILSQLFKLSTTGGTGTAGSEERTIRYTMSSSDSTASATLGNAEKYAMSIQVDTRTNSLIIGGTKRYIELVSSLIKDLDANPGQERRTRIYHPRHTQAVDIETALSSFMDQERQRVEQALGQDQLGAAQRMLEREVTVVAEPATNSLLISASPRYFEPIDAMIQQLDSAKPQVLIQVTLVEVALDDSTDLGFQWQYSKGIAGANVSGGTNFGLSPNATGMGVSITAGDLTMIINALQKQRKLEVLSRPQILASDNIPAHINVGQRVPFVTNSRVTDTGGTVNTIDYEDVGIILDVTARLTDDGFVHMDIKPEISSIDSSTVQISDNLNAIVVNTREAETSVTVQDGHTIVIGGLITTKDSKSEDKVPILGDIPILGTLFKSTKTSKGRTELLIILTPRIIRSVEDADAMSKEQRDRLELLQKIGASQTGDLLKMNGEKLNAKPEEKK